MKLVFNDPTFSYEVVRAISYSLYGGADIGEVLSTAYKIEEGNFEQWYTEWYKTAERIHGLAEESLQKNNKISAKQFFMRASNYYRTAEFFLHGNPDDPRSFGGLLAPRAAAFEHRLAALVANDGLFSFQFRKMGEAMQKAIPNANGDLNDPTYLKNFMDNAMKNSAAVRWGIENGMFTFRANSIPELVDLTEVYTLEGVADKIKCPTLVCEAEEDHAFKGQPQLLFNALTCPKTHMKFTVEEGAEEHCQFGGLLLFNHRLFEWLDETLKVNQA